MVWFINWLVWYIGGLLSAVIITWFYGNVVGETFNTDIMWFVAVIIFTLKGVIELAIINCKDDDK